MRRFETVTFAITPEMRDMVMQAVETGEFATPGEVFRDALRLWRARRLGEMRRSEAIERSIASGAIRFTTTDAADGVGTGEVDGDLRRRP